MKKSTLTVAMVVVVALLGGACSSTGATFTALGESRMDGGTFGSGHIVSTDGGGTVETDSTGLGGTFGSGH